MQTANADLHSQANQHITNKCTARVPCSQKRAPTLRRVPDWPQSCSTRAEPRRKRKDKRKRASSLSRGNPAQRLSKLSSQHLWAPRQTLYMWGGLPFGWFFQAQFPRNCVHLFPRSMVIKGRLDSPTPTRGVTFWLGSLLCTPQNYTDSPTATPVEMTPVLDPTYAAGRAKRALLFYFVYFRQSRDLAAT